ncbi:cytochrome c biogenesis protein ResB [Bailinhaonella thermotolerans]|uniref:Cytochrome c biogenesis protein ResB n=1 Tax=Bailinhaonella thermotolerans TaxID=1070861 RepID=A0A3A4AMP8_9ACTN|nr:cytochrome c biogenesis protein ResB [Bailinhaonella thermotolerans]RJL22513.1 cytochrome c biogenesis protein ResB [Bailinhaonella thermotolerans]
MITWLRWAWRLLTSMRTALILLFLVALGSVPGSVLPQRGLTPEDVTKFYEENPGLAPWLDRFSMFDVFGAPWFAAIYLLLFVSLAGCVLPRAAQHYRAMRGRPPAAPRNLSRLPHTASVPGGTLALAEAELRRRRFRVNTGDGWVAAEKGYLRETGNLVFHLALLALLFAVGSGALFGYRGNVLVVEGDGFANTVAAYDKFSPGRFVDTESLKPFSFRLGDFTATYSTEPQRRGQPLDFSGKLSVREGGGQKTHDLRVNEPLEAGGAQVYLLGNGYAPTFRVTDGKGQVAFDGAVPFLPAEKGGFTSEGVIKVPDAQPAQLGFVGLFLPTTVTVGDSATSAFPAALNPTVRLFGFKGDLGLRSGAPQSVYQLNSDKMQMIKLPETRLAVGQSLTLPDGLGTVTFTGVKEWISLQITYDPGRFPALVSAALAVLGLVPALTVRRRRIWVRQTADGIDVGGLTRSEGGGGIEEEFESIVSSLRRSGEQESRELVKE